MKLISAYIENFGKLKGYSCNFNERLTQFSEENGYGKTTLAAFIKSMFYGLPPIRANGKDFNDRKHFYPFDGGKFGGSVTFEWKGSTYRIERFFDRKSEAEDRVTVYREGQPFGGFGGDIGMAVFGLDKASFERTLFIDSDSIEIAATSGIGAKLNNFFDADDGTNTYESAINSLENAKKRLKAGRGSNDLITFETNKIAELKAEIADLERCERVLGGYYASMNALKAEISTDEERARELNNKKVLAEKWNVYNTHIARAREWETRKAELDKKYLKGFPNSSELDTVKGDVDRILTLNSAQNAQKIPEQRALILCDLENRFKGGVPDGEKLQRVKNDIVTLSDGERKLSEKDKNLDENSAYLIKKFAEKTPLQGDIKGAQERVERYKLLNDELKLRTLEKHDGVAEKGHLPILAIIFAAVALIGVGLLFVNKLLGGIILGVGVVGFVLGCLTFAKKGANTKGGGDSAKIQAEITSLEGKIREFLVPYGYYSSDGVVYDFAKFKDDFAKYCTIYEQNQRALNERTSLERELKEKRESLNVFFESYKITAGTFQDRYFALCSDIERYLNLKSENESFLKGTRERREEAEKLNAEVAQILNRYGILPRVDIRSQLEEILADSGEYARLNEGIRREKLEAENYKKDNSLGDMPQITESDRYIDARLSKNRHDLAVVEGQIADVESMVEKLDEKRAKLENEENTLAAYKQKYRLLCATADALKQAEQNLKLRYIAPIRDKFLTYADALETALGERVVMGRDYTLAFERGGEVRSDRHLSSGQRSLCALCFRLALIDNIFEGDKPFVIMDDPFVNLDSEHMKKTCSLLAKLSKDLQIIYFTCHQSRVLK